MKFLVNVIEPWDENLVLVVFFYVKTAFICTYDRQ